jgi:hypothetical protein
MTLDLLQYGVLGNRQVLTLLGSPFATSSGYIAIRTNRSSLTILLGTQQQRIGDFPRTLHFFIGSAAM